MAASSPCTPSISSYHAQHFASLSSSCSISNNRPLFKSPQLFIFPQSKQRRSGEPAGGRVYSSQNQENRVYGLQNQENRVYGLQNQENRERACRGDATRASEGLQRREFIKKGLVGSLVGAVGSFGRGPKDAALADIWPAVANRTPPPPVVKYRETKNATPFTVTYPDRFVEALNRNPGVEVSKDNGEETLALIGDFKTFDTVSVLRYPIRPGTPGTVSADEISEKLIIGGNIATEFLRKEMETPTDPSQGNKYHFEYVTEQCRGEVVEGLGGKRECFRGDLLLPTITRHHLVNVEAYKGFFYVVTASAAQTRWADAKPDFEGILSSFTLSEPVTQPLEG